MVKNFVFTVGLPGCGKSTWIENQYRDFHTFRSYVAQLFFCDSKSSQQSFDRLFDHSNNYLEQWANNIKRSAINPSPIVVAADDIKEFIPGYDNSNPEPVHEASVKYAEELVYMICDADFFVTDTLVMDGGGINDHYTARIIEHVRKSCPNVHIKCVYFDTPIEVCLERIANRERKVPTEAIYSKNQKIVKCIHKYKTMVDEFVRVNYFTNKYILLDMDGTICGYGKARFDEDGNADFVNGELFRHLLPVRSVIDFVKANYDMKNVYIVTAAANSIAWAEKNEWLDEHFPEIPKENRYFCGNKDYKYVFVKQLAEYKKWGRNEMVLVDDYHKTIELCKKHKINCVHPSNIESLTDPYAIFS